MEQHPRVLVLMRHATAEQDGPSDVERRLAERGHAEAADDGAWLAGIGITPELALVSSAARTAATWESAAEAAGWDADLATYDDGLYAAGPETALDLVRGVDAGVRTLLVLGHNPTIAVLAQTLDDGEGDDDATTRMTLGYPAGATTVLEVDGDWADLDEAGARVRAFHVPQA